MKKLPFKTARSYKLNPNWKQHISREETLYKRDGDLRSEFERDYTRIIHSKGYRRLKHKTQVFFAAQHDHVCTRSEHVTLVASLSKVIAKNLGLNENLIDAIANAHDIGHAPFGHHGERVIDKICKESNIDEGFWHERNSLFFVDNIETLRNPNGNQKNLNLTYAVRDGIICHCGEVDENAIYPRTEALNLYQISEPGQVPPYTWEACIVKLADKIAYLGRDIEDALLYRILDPSAIRELRNIFLDYLGKKETIKIIEINNTVLINSLALDLCRNSSPENGIMLSSNFLELVNRLKKFSIHNIYNHWRVRTFKRYATLMIETTFKTLDDFYQGWNKQSVIENAKNHFPLLSKYFENWLIKYTTYKVSERNSRKMQNHIVYDISDRQSYRRAIIGFISSMTDHFAIRAFNEIITF